MSFVVKELPRTDYQTLNTAGLGALQNHQNGYQVQVPTQVQALQAHNLGLGVPGVQDDPQRWTQYQHLWRQHVYNNINGNNKPAHGGAGANGTNGGHGGSIKDLTAGGGGGANGVLSAGPPDDKAKDENELWCNVEAQTAFLGPNLWDKTYETDLKYVDLDEFLSENGVSMDGTLGSNGGAGGGGTGGGIPGGGHGHQLPKRERSPSPSDCMSPDTVNPPSPADSSISMGSGRDFDPRTRVFSDEELKPQPMIKKSRKQFVPDNLKDDKYWARRRKNNMAAKRSRDARRMKENQIALRAGYLEKENMGLRQELERLKKENLLLLDKLSKCAEV